MAKLKRAFEIAQMVACVRARLRFGNEGITLSMGGGVFSHQKEFQTQVVRECEKQKVNIAESVLVEQKIETVTVDTQGTDYPEPNKM